MRSAPSSSARARLEATRQSFADFEHTRREKEAELQDCEAQRDRFRTQTAQVKTNTEYTALLHEIEGASSRISQLEEDVLVAMDEVDERRQVLADVETEQKQVERETEARVGELRKRLEQEQVVNYFDSPADLRAKAILSLEAAERKLRSSK